MQALDYKTKGICPQAIHVEVSDDGSTIEGVEFYGGCPGNTRAVAKLVKGRPVDEVVSMFDGHRCGNRSSSCADQMSAALHEAQLLARA